MQKKQSTVVISDTVRETGSMNGLSRGHFHTCIVFSIRFLIEMFGYYMIYFQETNQPKSKLLKQMAEYDSELAPVLFSRQKKIAKDDQPVREADAIRKR